MKLIFATNWDTPAFYQIKEQLWRNITVSSRIPKNESNELVALCTSPRPLTFRACLLLQGN